MSNEKVKSITEGTLLPISLVLMLVGGVVSITTMYNRVDENAKRISHLESRQELISIITTDIAVIKTQLATIERKLPDASSPRR